MCLDKITKVYKPSLFNLWIPKFAYKSGYGWKLVRKDGNGCYVPTCQSQDKAYLKNMYANEKNYRFEYTQELRFVKTKDGKEYKFGFHIFLGRKHPEIITYDGEYWVRVKYCFGHTKGIDSGFAGGGVELSAIVAKYMRILN